jgi:8-oxo-dGTP pyrophosphatase MutT (NUDIX family)
VRRPYEVLVFVRREEEFLVLHRSERQGAFWHSVSGGVELGESAIEAAERELREETGLEAEPAATGDVFTYVPDAQSPYAGIGTVRVDCFVAEAPADWEPALDWEHDDYRWCGLDEAAALLYWPEPREIVRKLAPRDRRRRA